MTKRARFAINVDSGVVVYRSESTDALPTLWKLIDDETASAIVKKEVDANAVIEAIQKSIARADGFNWKEYDAKRREELNLYNVSQRDMVPDNDAPGGVEEQDDDSDEVISLKDLGLGEKPTEKPTDKTAKKPTEKPTEKGGEAAGRPSKKKDKDDGGVDGIVC